MPNVTIGGESVYYESPHEIGGATPGARILFIHGPGADHRLFADQMRFFAPSQTPIALDLLGHGQSKGEALEDVPDWASFVEEFIDTLGLSPVVLVGHSLGGAIAIEYASRHPRLVEGLVLIGTGITFPWAADTAADLLEDPESFLENRALRGLREPHMPLAADALTAARKEQRPMSSMRDFVAAAKWDGTSRLGSIQTPTLIIYGEDDPLVAQAGQMLGAIPHASFDTIPLSRHFPHLEMPDILNDSLNRFVTIVPDLTYMAGGTEP